MGKNAFTGEELKRDVPRVDFDDARERKWSAPRVVYSETNPPPKVGLDCSVEPSRTDGSQAEACDINFILKRYQQTGVMPSAIHEGLFADVSDALTYQESLDLVIHAQAQFDALDAHTRKRFGNDPAEFLAFASDPKNAKELVDMGLATLPAASDADRIVGAVEGLREHFNPPSDQPSPSPAGSRSSKKSSDA